MRRAKRSGFKANVVAVYFLVAMLVSAALIGGIYRREMSLSAIRACQKAYRDEGPTSALLCGSLYAVFYSVFFALPFGLLHSVPGFESWSYRALAAAWAGLTVLMFGSSLFAFARAMPNLFLWAPWAFLSIFYVRALARGWKRARLMAAEAEKCDEIVSEIDGPLGALDWL